MAEKKNESKNQMAFNTTTTISKGQLETILEFSAPPIKVISGKEQKIPSDVFKIRLTATCPNFEEPGYLHVSYDANSNPATTTEFCLSRTRGKQKEGNYDSVSELAEDHTKLLNGIVKAYRTNQPFNFHEVL